MKAISNILLILSVLLFSVNLVIAQNVISIHGEPRTPDNQIELIHSLDVFDENAVKIENAELIIDNDLGYFEIKGLEAPTGEIDQKTVWVQGTCFLHTYYIKKRANQFIVMDAHEAEKEVHSTSNSNIDLGIIKEDKSVLVKIDSDDEIKFLFEDANGNWVAESGSYKKEKETLGNLETNKEYIITMEKEDGTKWEETITTGDYCEGTRIIKRGDYFEVENFEGNIIPKVSFFKKINLFFKGLFN